MAGFDGERYLRLLGERWVKTGGAARRPPHSPVLAAAAAALVAVDAITLAAAQAVVNEYDLSKGQGYRDPVSSKTAPPDIGELRVVPCERVIDRPGGRLTIHYVAFTSHATTMRADLRLDKPAPSQPGQPRQAHPDPLPAWARQLSITDSRGTTAAAVFSGSGRIGGRDWRGEYETDPRLAADAEWIELLGERLELAAPPAVIRTWVEPLPEQDPAIRHLWERVATINDFHDLHLAFEATTAALVAAGALPADAAVIGDARAALAVLRPRRAGPAAPPRDPAAPPRDPAAPPRDLPGPWPSLLTRWGQAGGPVRTIPVGAVTPPFDGITAAVIDLESRAEHFGITVELVPPARTGLPWAGLPDQPHVTWWAADDLGNYYLGEQGSWNPGADRARGAIGFWPALDRQATHVDLMPTAATARAVIRVPC